MDELDNRPAIPEESGVKFIGDTLRDASGNYLDFGDYNSRRLFSLIVGPPDKVSQGQSLGSAGSPAAASIDIVPTIAHILGFHDQIPGGLLPGRVLEEAFV
jgi:hypothetical protein